MDFETIKLIVDAFSKNDNISSSSNINIYDSYASMDNDAITTTDANMFHFCKPKLSTMLFISHSIATAANAGKIAFTENPLSINYAQWLAFAKYSLSQLKWVLLQKPALRNKYVQGFIDSDWKEIGCVIQDTWDELTQGSIVFHN